MTYAAQNRSDLVEPNKMCQTLCHGQRADRFDSGRRVSKDPS
jgi:hypothetical protein